MSEHPTLAEFALPEQLSDQYPQFPPARLRWWLRERERNGLAPHVRKLGKQLYLHVPGFVRWVDSHAA